MRPNLTALSALAGLGLAAACTHAIEGRGSGDGSLSAPRFARLTHVQWENTVQDLFGLPEAPGLATAFQPDPQLGRFDNNIARLTTGSGLWRNYQRAAETIAARVVDDPTLLARVVPADRPDDDDDAARLVIERLGRRAFRRPLTDAEVDRMAAQFAAAVDLDDDRPPFEAGVALTIETLLQSPYFLYRTELSDDGGAAVVALDDHEIASRLSYALANTMPDAELDAAADDGALGDEAGVRAHAERLLDGARGHAQLEHFHFQTFGLREYTDLDKDDEAFPEWSPALGGKMQRETLDFLEEVAFGGGSIADLYTSTAAFVDGDLAALYGVEGEDGDQPRRVELDATQRAGLLTRVGFLARNATLRDPDPIHRGVAINLDLLCRELDTVPAIPEDLMPTGDTNRERIESITGDGTCGAGCHSAIINPLGFALENFDALGRWRDEDGGQPVDAASAYTFEDGRTIEFADGVELSHQLAAAPEAHACYLRQVLEYVYGRDLTDADLPLLDELAADSVTEDLPIRELVLRVVTSPAFRFRTVE